MIDAPPFVSFDEHLRIMRARWAQGDHVSGFGHTGCGKSTLMFHLLALRSFVLTIGTKPTKNPDPTLTQLIKHYRAKVVTAIPDVPVGASRFVAIIWPRYLTKADKPKRRAMIERALDQAFADGHWTIAADEVGQLSRGMKLAPQVVDFYTQGRSQKATFIGFTQRPAHVPLEMYSEPTFVYLWRTRNGADLRRLSELGGGVDASAIKPILQTLPKHHVLWVHLPTGEMHITLPPPVVA